MKFEQIENANDYDCLLVSVATLAKYYGRDYNMISARDWKLMYDSNLDGKRIGEQIDVVSQIDSANKAMQFHGFTWEFNTFDEYCIDADTGSFKEILCPFIGSVDLYYLKRSKVYKKYHVLHYIIILEYNPIDEKYLCVDPYFQYEYYKITKEELYLGMDRYVKLDFCKVPKKSVEDYKKSIKEDIIMVNEENENYKNIKQLASDIFTKMNISYEFDEFKNNLYVVPVMDKMRKVAIYRSSYSCMLDYVYNMFEIKYLFDASSLIKQSATLWKVVQGKLLRTYLTNSINSERKTISQMISKIADIEKQAVEIILFNK
jgi:hypothetical protein